jgi:ankyrin repeat protein
MTTDAIATLTSIVDAGNPDRFRDALDTVEEMLDQSQKNTLLDYCISQQRFEEMGLVLLAGADPDGKRGNARLPLLIEAISRSQIEAALHLLIHGADVNAVDMMGDAAVHFAARRNLPAVIGLLSRNGADLSLRNHMGQDAFTLAAINGNPSVWHALEVEGAVPVDVEGLRRSLPTLTASMQDLVRVHLHAKEPAPTAARPSL